MTTLRIALAFAIATVVGGCSGPHRGLSDWFGGSSPSGVPETGQTYYSGVANLVVHAGASGSSAIVGRLPLHEKVVRTRTEHGYAYILASRTGLEGWVDNAKLIWRLPAQGGGPVQHPQPAEQMPPVEPPKPDDATAARPAQPAVELADLPASPVQPSEPAAPAVPAPEPSSTPRPIPKAFDPF